MALKVRARTPLDVAVVDAFLAERHSRRVARSGEVVHPLDHPALVAEYEGRLVGVLTYIVHGRRCEVLTLHVSAQRRGVGTALLQEVSASRGATDAPASR